ncbi:MAG: endonuclease domain-containing protein, partial [Nitrospira sp.]|nr:endonuclease domain-containing protein [Nitrospira sp.]
MTPAEQLLWNKLRSKQCDSLKFRRQHAIGPFIVDFYCPEQLLVVEIDGDVHAEETKITKDRQRERYLRSLDLQVIRYTNHEVMSNLDGVLEHLLGVLSSDSTS